MPDEEVKPIEPEQENKPLEVEAPKPEPVTVEPQKEVNPLEARLEAMEKRLNDRDEKEKIAAAQAKEVKHGEVQESKTESSRGDERDPILQKAKGNAGPGDAASGHESKGLPQPVKRVHRFKFKSRKPAK